MFAGLFFLAKNVYFLYDSPVLNGLCRLLTAAELQMFETGDPSSINPDMGVDEQADLLPYNK